MGKRVLIYDAAETSFVGKMWGVGSSVFRKHFDKVYAIKTVGDAYMALGDFPAGGISELQVWAHGSSGKILIAGENLDLGYPAWVSLRGGLLWARTCWTLAGARGHRFATMLGKQGISVAGHLGVIGPWGAHSHLVALEAGQAPWWSDTIHGKSSPWEPRTISALHMDLPSWAYRPTPMV